MGMLIHPNFYVYTRYLASTDSKWSPQDYLTLNTVSNSNKSSYIIYVYINYNSVGSSRQNNKDWSTNSGSRETR